MLAGRQAQLFVRLDKVPNLAPEGVYVAFPFAVENPRFWVQTTDAVFMAEREQLPHTCRDWYSIQHAVGVAGDRGAGVEWGSLDAPLVQLGGFHTGQWAEHLEAPAGHINSWLMNNLYFTNFKASQGGVDHFAYAFRPSEQVDRQSVARFGEKVGAAVLTCQWPGWGAGPQLAHVEITPDCLQIASVEIVDADVVVTVRSLSASPTEGRVGWSGSQVRARLAGGQSALLAPGDFMPVNLGPYGEAVIILTPSKGHEQ